MMKKLIKSFAFLFLIITLSAMSMYSQNLLQNGDFESGGNGNGFYVTSADYLVLPPPFTGGTFPGYCGFTDNPQLMNPTLFISGGDHTTGKGNMMVIDGNLVFAYFWRTGNFTNDYPGGISGLSIGATYTFTYWIKSVSTTVTDVNTSQDIRIHFFNVANIKLISGSTLAPLPALGWQKVVYTFEPIKSNIGIEIASLHSIALGNDFAIDDLSLKVIACSIPPTVTSPVYYCKGDLSPSPLSATATAGSSLIWYGTSPTGGTPSGTAPTPSTAVVGSTTYYVSQTDGVCESARTPIVVNVVADNGATILGFRCDPSQIPIYSLDYTPPATVNNSVFFDWSNNPLISNTYNFSYSIQGGPIVTGSTGLSHWLVPNMLPGQSATLTLTSATHPCVPAQTITCTVPCGSSTVTPTFNPIPTSYCINDVPPILPTTSTNTPPITGTWSPFPVDTSTMGTTTYTFTPDPILFPCALPKPLSISVEPIEPDFSNFSICSGDPAPSLSNVSPNGITGTWNPSAVDNMNSASYVFTPDPGQPCTPTDKTINVTVNPSNAILNLKWTVTEAFAKNQIVTVTDPVGTNYLYQMDSGPFHTSPVFENVASGMHSVTVKDINGCSELTNNNVLVIGYPKYFTPNGDTYNDFWNISALSDQLNARIYIFDRYGKLLKDISPKDSGWDGTYIGQPMPADDYWFTVEYVEQSIVKKYKSHFSLKR